MSAQKKMTVEDSLKEVRRILGYCGRKEWPCDSCLKKALLTFAAQEVQEATEPLVEALEKISKYRDEVGLTLGAHSAREALTAHRLRFPKK